MFSDPTWPEKWEACASTSAIRPCLVEIYAKQHLTLDFQKSSANSQTTISGPWAMVSGAAFPGETTEMDQLK